MTISAATQLTQGGRLTFSVFSGGVSGSMTLSGFGFATNLSGSVPFSYPLTTAPGHVVIWSGPGRMNEIVYLQYITSGGTLPIFYDNNQPTVSGPNGYVGSGCTVVGFAPPNLNLTASGVIITYATTPTIFGTPFFNGLSVYNGLSGMPGFTVTFTPGVQN